MALLLYYLVNIFKPSLRFIIFIVWINRLAAEKLKPIDGLLKLRKWIEDRGLKRAAVTNAPRANAELMISTLGLSDFFEALILGDECEHAKPHPQPYLKALEILKVSKDHTMIFEVCMPCSFCASGEHIVAQVHSIDV